MPSYMIDLPLLRLSRLVAAGHLWATHPRSQAIWRRLSAVALFNAALALWLMMWPGGHAVAVAGDRAAQFVGPLLALPWCLARRGGHSGRLQRTKAGRRTPGAWVPFLLGAGIAGAAAGQVVFTVYDLVLHQPAPFPSWAHAGYRALYPALILAVLLLPARRPSAMGRVRMLIDGAMIMTGAITASWYFILGPSIIGARPSGPGKLVSAAYPLWDLVLVISIVLLTHRSILPGFRPAARLLMAALGVIVLADSALSVRGLARGHVTGSVLDVGWPLGVMLVGVAAYAVRQVTEGDGEPASPEHDAAIDAVERPHDLSVWHALLPYALFTGLAVLVALVVKRGDPTGPLASGVYVGGAAVMVLILLRQTMVIVENRALYRRLDSAYVIQGQALAHRVAELEMLLDSATALSSTLDRDQILITLARHIVTTLDAANAAFTYVDRATRQCRSLANYARPGCAIGFSDEPWEALDDYPELEVVLVNMTPFHGYIGGPTMSEEESAYLLRHDFQAELMVPLVVRGESIGVLEVHWTHRVEVDESMLALCTAIATQAAIALENARLYEDATTRADRDALTGLPNRSCLARRLHEAIAESQGGAGPLSLLLLDLDRFKEINDTLGHHCGDLLLQQVAERLQTMLRTTDTVGRLGGDEFAVLLPDTDQAGAERVAAAIKTTLETPIIVESQAFHTGVSIGLAICPDHGADATTLLRRADVAMYVAKRGRHSYAVYTPQQDKFTPERLALTEDLRLAIDRGDLRLSYQPKIHLASGRVDGVEALVRWDHPSRGSIAPDHFIPLAEQTGQIGPLTRWVLEAALRQCRAWAHLGLHLGVAVNLSIANLHDAKLPDTIAQLLEMYGVAASDLRVEVTESMLMADVQRARAVLDRIAALGIGVSVDDYGTGYSSLAHLKRLPVGELKIDRAFIQQMARDEADAAIVASTIGLGHSLGLRVVAEGVEDEATLHRLQCLGCDVAQGHYLGPPQPAHVLEAWLLDAQRASA